MLGVFAEFETNLRGERQMEVITKAKAAGVHKGGKTRITADEVQHSGGRLGGLSDRLAAGDRPGER